MHKNKKSLAEKTSDLTSSITRINLFSQVNFYTRLIHFSQYLMRTQKHEIKHSYCIYTLYSYFVFFYTFKNYQSFD